MLLNERISIPSSSRRGLCGTLTEVALGDSASALHEHVQWSGEPLR
jgi:hypothetical protein